MKTSKATKHLGYLVFALIAGALVASYTNAEKHFFKPQQKNVLKKAQVNDQLKRAQIKLQELQRQKNPNQQEVRGLQNKITSLAKRHKKITNVLKKKGDTAIRRAVPRS